MAFRRIEKDFIYSAVICICYFVVVFLFMNVQFNTPDDYIMTQITAGAYGEYSPYTANMNIICGAAEAFLFRHAPFVNWHTAFLLLVLLSAFTALTFIVMKYTKSVLISVLAPILPGCMIFPFFFQSVIVSYMSILAGFIMWIAGTAEKENKILKVCSCAFFVCGALLCRQCLYTSLVFFVFLTAADFLVQKFMLHEKKLGLSSRRNISVAAGAFLLSFVLWAGHDYVCALNTSCRDFAEYTKRTDAVCSNRLEYDQAEEMYKRIGWSKNDVSMIYTSQYDDEFFSADNFKKLDDAKKLFLKKQSFQFQDIVYAINNQTGNIIGILIMLFVLSYVRRQMIFYGTASFFASFFIFLGIVISDRPADSIIMPQWITAIALIFVLFLILQPSALQLVDYQDAYKKNLSIFLIFSMFVTSVLIFTNMAGKSQESSPKNISYMRDLVSYLSTHKSNFYVYDTYSLDSRAFSIFEIPVFGQYENASPSGDWFTGIPANEAAKAKYGIKAPFEALLNNKHCFYITAKAKYRRDSCDRLSPAEKAEQICIFLKEHRNIDASGVLVESFGVDSDGQFVFDVYKLQSK